MQGLIETQVHNVGDVLKLIAAALYRRTKAATQMNATSSRSHMLMRLTVITKTKKGQVRIGVGNFADLAGSEDQRKTGAKGQRLEEAKKINLSLLTLEKVINALSNPTRSKHIPYRESTLTHVLKDSLGGNCKTTLVVNVSPHIFNRSECKRTLHFAQRCKLIKNKAKINRVYTNDELMIKLKQMQDKNDKLNDIIKKKTYESFKNNDIHIIEGTTNINVESKGGDNEINDNKGTDDNEMSQLLIYTLMGSGALVCCVIILCIVVIIQCHLQQNIIINIV